MNWNLLGLVFGAGLIPFAFAASALINLVP